jgi:nucleotide-binding universal stress UspA family protein
VLDEGAALAVVGSRGRGFARAALAGSVSGALVGSSPCPVVVVSPEAAVDIAPEPTIVCGVDGSPDSDAALEQAASLASTLGGQLLAVHVRPNALAPHATSLMPGKQPFNGSVDETRAAVATVERPLAHLDVDIPIGMRLETGYVAVRLAAVAAQQPGSILVVGSRGRGALQAAVFGSVSSRLAASAPVPVMIVPPELGG